MKIHEYIDKGVNHGLTSFNRLDPDYEHIKAIHELLIKDLSLRKSIKDSKMKLLDELYPNLTLVGMVQEVVKNYKLKVEFTPSHLVWSYKKDSNQKTIINSFSAASNRLGSIVDYSSLVIDDLYDIIINNGL